MPRRNPDVPSEDQPSNEFPGNPSTEKPNKRIIPPGGNVIYYVNESAYEDAYAKNTVFDINKGDVQ